MARYNAYTYPLDVPVVEGPGRSYREQQALGNDHFGYLVAPEDPIRAQKGDLSMSSIKDFDPKPLSNGLPWKGLR